MKKFRSYIVLIIMLVLLIPLCVLVLLNVHTAYITSMAALCIVVSIAGLVGLIIYERFIQNSLDTVFKQNSEIASKIINNIDFPCLFCDLNGNVIWANNAMKKIIPDRKLSKQFAAVELSVSKEMSYEKTLGENTYIIKLMRITRHNKRAKEMLFMHLKDITNERNLKDLYEQNCPVAMLLYVDNYEDYVSERDITKNTGINNVEQMVAELTQSISGIYRRFEGGKFMIMFESKHLKGLMEKRFEILDSVHSITISADRSLTISIGVGQGETIEQAHESALSAMELALGRGGDQAVVKSADGTLKYYGGKHLLTTGVSKVRVRSIATSLRRLMKDAGEIFIMGHSRADMDCIGSAFGLMACGNYIGKETYYIIEGGLPTVEKTMNGKLIDRLSKRILTPEEAINKINKKSLLIIVDTQREALLCSKEIFRAVEQSQLVVMDHHRRMEDAITNAVINYMESGASSVAEMITELMQCFFDKKMNMSFEATALLAGICLDTKFFAFNTGTRTFEAAGYLKRCGADTTAVKKMFKDDMSMVVARANVVQRAKLICGSIAISYCTDDMPSPQIVAAQAADELITVRGINAAFVLTPLGTKILISARSLGDINVQLICESLGGGGHLTGAGAQLTDYSMDEALELVKKTVEAFIKEENLE